MTDEKTPRTTLEAAPPATAGPASSAAGLALYFVRHADAGVPLTWMGDDAGRPLSKKGRRQARRLGRHLDALGVNVDLLLTSPKVRAADTATLVGKAIGAKATIDPALASGFDAAELRAVITAADAAVSSVMFVGHDPDLSDLLSWLVGAHVGLRNGALARVDLATRAITPGDVDLRWLLAPDALGG